MKSPPIPPKKQDATGATGKKEDVSATKKPPAAVKDLNLEEAKRRLEEQKQKVAELR